MNTRQKTKGGTISIDILHYSLHFTNFSNFGYRTKLESSGFLSKMRWARRSYFVGQCSRCIHIHCSKRSATSRSSVMVERIDVSVRYNLAKTRWDSDIVTISVPMISTQKSVDVWKLDTATTAQCCHSIVRALFCCSRCPLPTPQNILAAKISWRRWGHRAARL